MPHEQPITVQSPSETFGGHPLTIKGDLTMTIPEPHSMVSVGRATSSFREHDQQMKLFTLIGVDHSPRKPRLESGIVKGIELKLGNNKPQRFTVDGDCEIKIFFTHR